jgi:hypothetical protein
MIHERLQSCYIVDDVTRPEYGIPHKTFNTSWAIGPHQIRYIENVVDFDRSNLFTPKTWTLPSLSKT